MTTVLAGDIGGTKTLLSLHGFRGDRPVTLASGHYPSADWSHLADLVRHFLAASEAARDHPPAAACFAVAGPVQAGRARLTNLPWQLEEEDLARRCGIARVDLVNDFAVLVYGLPHLAAEQWQSVRQGSCEAEEPVLILGAGTGLGVAMGLPVAGGLQAVASEAAHGSFAPRTAAEWELSQWLQQDLGVERLSIERVVSGTGLGHVFRWLLATRPEGVDHPLQPACRSWRDPSPGTARVDLPAAVAEAARRGDPLARRALDLWLEAYGAVCGDLALTFLSRGGIWLAGGTAAKLLAELRGDRFAAGFLAKGRLRPVLEPIAIRAAVDPALGTFSAAWRARLLVA
jgi:glucokinase